MADETIGVIRTRFYGPLTAVKRRYRDGNLCVTLLEADGKPAGSLSVNVKESKDLPPSCFYVKTWTENIDIARAAAGSGLFRRRRDLPQARCGFEVAGAWEVLPLPEAGELATDES